MKFLHPTDPSEYLHWPAIEVKFWVLVDHGLQLLSISTVNTSGRSFTFLKSEFKDLQKTLTENL